MLAGGEGYESAPECIEVKNSLGSMSMRKPLIGVTGPEHGGWLAWICTRLLIWLAGGKAMRITPQRPIRAYALDGLVLGGGTDVRNQNKDLAIIEGQARANVTQPQTQRPGRKLQIILWQALSTRLFHFFLRLGRRWMSAPGTTEKMDRQRDELELQLLGDALAKGIPVLGIGRGGQLINVHYGGSLHQSLSGFYVERPHSPTTDDIHQVHLSPKSHLAHILQQDHVEVNALQDQVVERLGTDLVAAAHTLNGRVKAIEHVRRPYVIGVHWRPEFLPLQPEQRRLFHQLIESARGLNSL